MGLLEAKNFVEESIEKPQEIKSDLDKAEADKVKTPDETASEAKDGKIENNDLSTKDAIEPEPEDEEKDNTALEIVEKEAE